MNYFYALIPTFIIGNMAFFATEFYSFAILFNLVAIVAGIPLARAERQRRKAIAELERSEKEFVVNINKMLAQGIT